jgi:hypothetical protein
LRPVVVAWLGWIALGMVCGSIAAVAGGETQAARSVHRLLASGDTAASVSASSSALSSPTFSVSTTRTASRSPCPSGQVFSAAVGGCVCASSFAVLASGGCACPSSMHTVGVYCYYNTIVKLNAASTALSEGEIATWGVSVLHPLATSDTILLDVAAVMLPSGIATHSLVQFNAARSGPQTLSLPVPFDGIVGATQLVNVSATVAASGTSSLPYQLPLSNPSLVFMVMDRESCPSSQKHVPGRGCVVPGCHHASCRRCLCL